MRLTRAPRARLAIAVLTSFVLTGALAAPSATSAAWTDMEVATGSFAAGTVTPVTAMTCTAGLAQPVTFNWTAPIGGLTRTGYRWTVTGGFSASGTALATSTSVQLTSGLLGLGTGTFSLYAVGPGGWESVVKTGSLSFTTGLLSTCSVP